MPCFISFRDVSYAPSLSSVLVTVLTDVPSHLWARVSANNPQIHKKSGVRRGYPMIEDLRFCFTAFTDYEQNETGDTLSHTFTLPDWSICQTKFIYFYGSQSGVICMSTSPPFKYHNDGMVGNYRIIFVEPWDSGWSPPSEQFDSLFSEPWTPPGAGEFIPIFFEGWNS